MYVCLSVCLCVCMSVCLHACLPVRLPDPVLYLSFYITLSEPKTRTLTPFLVFTNNTYSTEETLINQCGQNYILANDFLSKVVPFPIYDYWLKESFVLPPLSDRHLRYLTLISFSLLFGPMFL